MSKRHPQMQTVPIRELEDRYSEALESIHLRLLKGAVSQSQARTQRMQQLFGSFNIHVEDAQALEEYTQFRRDYDTACQVVRGSHELLQHFVRLGVRRAVILSLIHI